MCNIKKVEVSLVKEQNYELAALFFSKFRAWNAAPPPLACGFDKILTDDKVFYFSKMTLPADTTHHK